MNVFDLTGKVVWVTGASRGLGRAIAIALVEAGAHVAATARSRENLRSLSDEAGEAVSVYPGEVNDSASMDEIATQIVADHGRLDGLVNCAGVSPSFERIEKIADDTWNDVLDVNLTGTFYCSRAAGRVMKENGLTGSIINISSVHAAVGFERIAAYAASKGGIHALTKQMAVEWADDGIRVNAIAPGYFETDLSAGLLNSWYGERIRNSAPLKRTGNPSELGPAAVYLLCDGSSFVTGTTLDVDGGWQAW
jgi:NAD(P)-dependent dehydrogenase (short-subunit alcohol dehydrogenase family)